LPTNPYQQKNHLTSRRSFDIRPLRVFETTFRSCFCKFVTGANTVHNICAIRSTRGLRPTNMQQIVCTSGPVEHELCECEARPARWVFREHAGDRDLQRSRVRYSIKHVELTRGLRPTNTQQMVYIVRLQTHWDKFGILLTDTFPEYCRFNQLIT
jgi:hypothetical protein